MEYIKIKYVCEAIILCVVLYRIKSGLLLRKIFGSVKDEIECAWRENQIKKRPIRFEVLTIVYMKSIVSWNVTLCSLVEVYGCFGGTYCLHNQCRRVSRGSNMPLLAASLACSKTMNAEPVGSVGKRLPNYKALHSRRGGLLFALFLSYSKVR
jgi:hypothetical protein